MCGPHRFRLLRPHVRPLAGDLQHARDLALVELAHIALALHDPAHLHGQVVVALWVAHLQCGQGRELQGVVVRLPEVLRHRQQRPLRVRLEPAPQEGGWDGATRRDTQQNGAAGNTTQEQGGTAKPLFLRSRGPMSG